jgi:putative transposase
MAHTYCSALFHCVFSTKERRSLIKPELQDRLWAYMGGIARENRMTPLAVGGTDDHAHLLLSVPSTVAIAVAMQKIKGGSSLWLHEDIGLKGFEWQQGYGAFSIGCSQVEATMLYIAGQQDHHRKRDFQAEFLEILKRHKIDYDPQHVWG